MARDDKHVKKQVTPQACALGAPRLHHSIFILLWSLLFVSHWSQSHPGLLNTGVTNALNSTLITTLSSSLTTTIYQVIGTHISTTAKPNQSVYVPAHQSDSQLQTNRLDLTSTWEALTNAPNAEPMRHLSFSAETNIVCVEQHYKWDHPTRLIHKAPIHLLCSDRVLPCSPG